MPRGFEEGSEEMQAKIMSTCCLGKNGEEGIDGGFSMNVSTAYLGEE